MSDFLLELLNRVAVNLELPSAIFLCCSEEVFIVIEPKAALSRKAGLRDEGREGGRKEVRQKLDVYQLLDIVMLKVNAFLGFSSYKSQYFYLFEFLVCH